MPSPATAFFGFRRRRGAARFTVAFPAQQRPARFFGALSCRSRSTSRRCPRTATGTSTTGRSR